MSLSQQQEVVLQALADSPVPLTGDDLFKQLGEHFTTIHGVHRTAASLVRHRRATRKPVLGRQSYSITRQGREALAGSQLMRGQPL